MIISYEMMLRNIDTLHKIPFDLIICDEAHRLKNSSTKTASAVMGFATRRRVALTGTPVQNDLQEFFAIVEFTNPGILGSVAVRAMQCTFLVEFSYLRSVCVCLQDYHLDLTSQGLSPSV